MEIPVADLLQGSFSVVVAAFLLFRIEKELKHLAQAIEQLRLCQVCKWKDGSESEISN
jgi:hypothetical protein